MTHSLAGRAIDDIGNRGRDRYRGELAEAFCAEGAGFFVEISLAPWPWSAATAQLPKTWYAVR